LRIHASGNACDHQQASDCTSVRPKRHCNTSLMQRVSGGAERTDPLTVTRHLSRRNANPALSLVFYGASATGRT